MEVVAGTAGGPFSRRNVQEWSRLDRLTGLLETARVETDHWANNTDSSTHHFGKVVDARSRNLADGGQEQRLQTKQLEVFQAQVPGGSLQVIRSSTTSSWQTHKTLSGNSGWATGERSERLALPSPGFDHLKLTLNPLDLSSQKTKASVGRSGSIGSRRPPSRPRSIAGTKPEDASDGRRVAELSKNTEDDSGHQRLLNGFNSDNDNIATTDSLVGINHSSNHSSTEEVKKSSSVSTVSSSHLSLIRKKSCSSEDLHVVDEEVEADSNTSDWRRSSKVRRSLQFPPKPNKTNKETIVIPVTKSVNEIKKEIEARKQLVTNSFRANQWNNFAELEGVLGVVNKNNNEEYPKDGSNSSDETIVSPTKTKKRQTFITAESLKEVRGRLRKLNSPVDEVLKNDEIDDGIVTEVKASSPLAEQPEDSSKNSVKSYVFGMEVMLRKTKPPGIGTGSLESRSSNKSLVNGASRTEEWYNRRKSYGFEQVSNQQNNYSSFEKSKIESSTDSGICRSSDTFPSWSKLADKSSTPTNPIKTTHTIMIKSYLDSDSTKQSDIEGDAIIQKGRKTVVNLMNTSVNPSWSWNSTNGGSTNDYKENKQGLSSGKIADTIRSLREKSTVENSRLSEPITISIPIQQSSRTKQTDPTDLLLKQTKSFGSDKAEETIDNSTNGITPYSELLFGKDSSESSSEHKSVFENIPWRGSRTKALSNFFDSEFKRHSIAVDQTKYLSGKPSFGSYYINGSFESGSKEIDNHNPNNSVVLFNHNENENNKGSVDSDHELNTEKKHKRVEFCKTEVHFAAEPGRFNIVETDGKPPPSNLYRRRRKTVSDATNRSGLPEIRFGDTQYEKTLLTTAESNATEDITPKSLVFRGSPVLHEQETNNETLFTHSNDLPTKSNENSLPQQTEINKYTVDSAVSADDDLPKPRSILKNNIPKPKPYLLGETPETNFTDESASWGVKLKSVKSDDESPKWHNESNLPKETEFQRLLKSLRPAASKPSDLFECSNQPELSATAADNGLEVRISSASSLPDNRRASWSVADRIRHVEEAKGYSTKVNFGPKETTVVDMDQQYNSPDGLRNNWLVKDQSSSYDTESMESGPKVTKRLTHSQSFNTPPSERVRDSGSGDVLKSTSLVLEVQNPTLNQPGEFERKSAKEVSTNLVRDSCSKNYSKCQLKTSKLYSTINENIMKYSQRANMTERERKKNYEVNTKTIPPVRKTSSGTQTYFVNRSSVRKDFSQATSINVNSTGNSKYHKDDEELNGIPGVLNALDDLSRCIDEVIIESPQRVSGKVNSSTKMFKFKEDIKKEDNCPSNIGQSKPEVLDLLREMADSGEVSEDSLKADEEVRAYMSTDNDDSELSGSWSRIRTLKQNSRQSTIKDGMSRISPSFSSIPDHQVTSISLGYEEPSQTTSTSRTQPEIKLPLKTFVSRSLINTNSSEIPSRVELSSSGDRIWSFSKTLQKDNTFSKYGDSNFTNQKSIFSAETPDKLAVRDESASPARFSRSSQSPCKESLFLERTAERNIMYNENNRQTSTSPTSGTSNRISSLSTIKLDSYQNSSRRNDKSSYPVKPFANHCKISSQSTSSSVLRSKVEDKVEFVKKNEAKKSINEVKTKERKLSTSSSGRDGWLNTPKEVQARKKIEPSVRKVEPKKENKSFERSSKPNNTRSSQKRTESPIYQNREIYAEKVDSNDNTETESTILEELTKAADQILLAVNGYTDEDSFRASSEDEFRKTRERTTSQPLCTISELPSKKSTANKISSRQVIKSTRSTDLRKEMRSSSKTMTGKISSNSSMEGGTTSLIDMKPLLSPEDRSKRRAARLLQRASSRELLLQAAASSSEDIGSGSDTGSLRTKRVFRRSRHSGSKQDLSARSAESRPKDRAQQSISTSETVKTQRTKAVTDSRCSRHTKATTGVAVSERHSRERRPTAVTHVPRTQKKKETSQ